MNFARGSKGKEIPGSASWSISREFAMELMTRIWTLFPAERDLIFIH